MILWKQKSPLISISSALITLLTLSACESPFSKSSFDLADGLTQELRTPVFIWSDPANYCVNQQLETLIESTKNTSDWDKSEIVSKTQKLRAIILEESTEAPNIIGNRIELTLKRKNFWTWLGTANETVETDLIEDQRRPESGAEWPSTSVVIVQNDLYITPVHATDQSQTLRYTTDDAQLYHSKPSARTLERLQKEGKIQVEITPSTGINCGNQIKVIDLKKHLP